MKYLFFLLVLLGFGYWLMHAGLLPPKVVPSPLLEYMAENEQRQINEIRNDMRVLQKELNAIRNAGQPGGDAQDAEIANGLAKRMKNGDLTISLDEILKPGSAPARVSAEEKRIREQLLELSSKLDQHRAKLIWCQRGLAP